MKKRVLIGILLCLLFISKVTQINMIFALSKQYNKKSTPDATTKYSEAQDYMLTQLSGVDEFAPILFWTPIATKKEIAIGEKSRDYVAIICGAGENEVSQISICRLVLDNTVNKDEAAFSNYKVTSLYDFTSVKDIDAHQLSSYDWNVDTEEKGFRQLVYKTDSVYYSEGEKSYKGLRYRYANILSVLEHVCQQYVANGEDTDTKIRKLKDAKNDLITIETLLTLYGFYIVDAKSIAQQMWTNKSNNRITWFSNIDKTSSILNLYGGADLRIGYKYTSNQNTQSGELQNFTNFLNKIVSTKLDISEYPILDSLTKSYTKTKEELNNFKKQEAVEQAQKAANEAVANFMNLTAFEKWSVVIKNYVSSNGQQKSLSDVKAYINADNKEEIDAYNLDFFQEWVLDSTHINNQASDQKDTLTEEEVLRLRAYGNIACTKQADPVTNLEIFNNIWSKENKRIGISNSGYNPESIRNNAQTVIKAYSTSTVTTDTLTNIMHNFNSLVRYEAAKIYGFTIKNPLEIDDEEINYNNLDRSEVLESIYPDFQTGISTSIWYDEVPNRTLKLQYIAETESAYKAYCDLQYILLLANTYASDVTISGLKKTTDVEGNFVYTNELLEEYIKEHEMGNMGYELNKELASQAKAYIEITKGLKYLGVSEFSEPLKALTSYYNTLIGIESIEKSLDDYVADIENEPLSTFFNVSSREFSYYYNIGVALSATYIPMQTNVYDVNSLQALEDTRFVEEFHYPYGFYRKALYIDKDINSAISKYVTGKCGTTRIATLADLLECEKDITLYIDDNFYNIDKLAQLQQTTYSRLSNIEEIKDEKTLLEKFGNLFGIESEVSLEEIVKTSNYSSYNSNVKKNTVEYSSKEEDKINYVLSHEKINKYLTGYSDDSEVEVYNEYTPLQSFAVVSSIYRKSDLYSIINVQAKNPTPVFVSSPNLAAVEGISRTEWNTIYNYIMLKNLKGNMGIDYKTTLDLDSPIYIDIYGNILTESGLVIIPAASNASLQQASAYNVYTVGYLSLSDNGYELPSDYNNADKYAIGYNQQTGTTTGMFKKNEETNTIRVASKKINGFYINFRDLPVADQEVIETLVTLHKQSLATKNNMLFPQRVYLITEVLRGAPIEFINKQFEGLTSNKQIHKYGIYLAYKLEELAKNLFSSSNGNSLITFPNLAYLEHYEVFMMFIYKIVFAAMIGMLLIKVYMDVVQRRLGLRSIFKFISTLVLLVIVIYLVPNIIDFSYYTTNKMLLQEEAGYIAILNLEKRNDGREIGVNSITEPTSETTLYIKLDSIHVPWYKATGSILSTDSFKTMSEIYKEAISEKLMANLPGVVIKSNGIYMDVNSIFDSTKIEYDSENRALYNIVTTAPYASYVSPYYVILDQLVARVNEYNKNNNMLAYTTTIQSKGAIRTKGLIQAYFESEYFMEQSQDVLGFDTVYGVKNSLKESSIFTDEDIEKIQRSLWYSELTGDAVREKLTELDMKARKYIVRNRNLINKISDETFLKCMALTLAIEYNKLFHISAADSLELFNVDTRDIIRLSLTNRTAAMNGASKSFARFVYDESGTLGVISAALLVVVYFITSFIKPIFMLIVLASLIVSLVIRRLFKRDEEHTVEGFLISLLLICGTNIVYALCLKGIVFLPKLDVSTLILVVIQVLIQSSYIGIILILLKVIQKDWRSLGFNIYRQKVENLTINKFSWNKLSKLPTTQMFSTEGMTEYEKARKLSYYNKRKKTAGYKGSQILDMMIQRDAKQNKKIRKRE